MKMYNDKGTHSDGIKGPEPHDTKTSKSGEDAKTLADSPKWRHLLYDFSQDTTMHGVRFTTLQSRFIIRRIIWFFITGGALGIFMFYLVDRVSFYLSFQKNVNVEVNYIDEVDFPAVTICNQNQFKLTTATSGGYYDQVRTISQSASSGGSVQCESSEFRCDNKCIVTSQRCDGVADCLDQTDENVDTCGCIRLEVTGNTGVPGDIEDTILNQVFEVDQSLDLSGRWVYFSKSDSSDDLTYLLYDNATHQWVFSHVLDTDRADSLLETTDATEVTPGEYSGQWTHSSGNVDLVMHCTAPEPAQQTLDSLVTSPANINSLKDMYEIGAHQIQDLIQGCSWKGRTCSWADFLVTDTDLGRCFTYKPKGQIEQSGPGFGLGVTVNIQQYEYTKNTQEGVGLQVLLHNPDEPPMMTERSFAVSPGLYSLVTIERTEVENLKPPWGQCEQRDLYFYDTYSVNTCNLDCLNERVREECQCKDIYMPEPQEDTEADVGYCSVDQYTNCWKPKLDELRLLGNYCSCATPCEEILYVPSLSFSSISSDQDLLRGEDLQKMILMRENLIQAREVTYRIHEDKFLNSMRVMTQLIRQSKQTQTRIKSVERTINTELELVRGLVGQVNADCLWLNKEQQKLIDLLNMYLQPIIETIFQNMYFNVHLYAMELPHRIQEIYDCWDAGNCGFETCRTIHNCTEAVQNVTLLCGSGNCTDAVNEGDYFSPVTGESCTLKYICKPSETRTWQTMAKPLVAKLQSSLNVLNQTMSNETMTNIQTVLQNGTLKFILQPDFMQPLVPYIRAQCHWCFSSNTSVTQLLSDTLHDALLVDVPALLQGMQVFLDELNDTHLYNGSFLLENTSREQVLGFVASITNTTTAILASIENKIKQPIREAVTMISELLRLVTPRCGSEMRKLYNEYIDEHGRMKTTLEDTREFIHTYGANHQSYQDSYQGNTLSLTELHSNANFDLTSTYVQSSNLTLESRFQDRQITLNRLQEHLDNLYYWFSAQVPNTSLASGSLLWQRFGIVTAQLESGDDSGNSLGVAMDEGYTFTDSGLQLFWSQLSQELEVSRSQLGVGITSMLSQISVTQSYIDNFVSGNEISETFYSKNFLQVDIFYKELTERNVKQLKAYEYAALLGEVGGLMGLLLGASVMTLCEVIDLLFYNSCVKCNDRVKGRKPIKVNPDEEKTYS